MNKIIIYFSHLKNKSRGFNSPQLHQLQVCQAPIYKGFGTTAPQQNYQNPTSNDTRMTRALSAVCNLIKD